MSGLVTDQPLVLMVDDDEAINKMMEFVLKKVGVRLQSYTTAEDFLSGLKKSKPDLCVVDLNIGKKTGVGYTIIQAIRSVLGFEIPVFVLSANSEPAFIAHAMEVGADDYIVKPIDRALLQSKLMRYIQSSELEEEHKPFFPLNSGRLPVEVNVDYEVEKIDEFGVTLRGKHLAMKGSSVFLGGDFIDQLTERERPLRVTVTSTWVVEDSADQREYGHFGEFDRTDHELLSSVRRWISENLSKS